MGFYKRNKRNNTDERFIGMVTSLTVLKIVNIQLNIVEDMKEINLELHKHITFDQLVKHGLENGANVVNGMPWSWKINGKAITHENDGCYIIETLEGSKHFYKGEYLVAYESGLQILIDHGDSHAPCGCPM